MRSIMGLRWPVCHLKTFLRGCVVTYGARSLVPSTAGAVSFSSRDVMDVDLGVFGVET